MAEVLRKNSTKIERAKASGEGNSMKGRKKVPRLIEQNRENKQENNAKCSLLGDIWCS